MRPLRLVYHPKETCFPTHCFRTRADSVWFPMDEKYYAAETYQFVYKENPAIGLCGLFPRSGCLGYHYKDIERITYFYDDKSTLVRVMISAHSNEHQYVSLVPVVPVAPEDGQDITVYVAKGSHAFYKDAGIQWRIFGFANDLCGKGRVQVFTDADVQELTEPAEIVELGFTVEPMVQPPVAKVLTKWQRFLANSLKRSCHPKQKNNKQKIPGW